MEAGIVLFAIRDATNFLEAKGLLRVDGTFGDFANVQHDAELVGVVETSLREHGLVVPEQVDKIVNALPGIIGLLR
jgi:hypothetical protein